MEKKKKKADGAEVFRDSKEELGAILLHGVVETQVVPNE